MNVRKLMLLNIIDEYSQTVLATRIGRTCQSV
jgi:hypothetical protein